MAYKLLKPTPDLENPYMDFIDEWKRAGEDIIPYAARYEERDFSHLLARWCLEETDTGCGAGFVPCSLYFLTDDQMRISGAIHIRHRLNDALMKHGGHIGYGIRPSERNKGLATGMLSMGLIIARELGIKKALLTCSRENRFSARVISANGGILENEISEGDTIIQRYWIDNR